jgi:hypothetical protein
VKRETFWTDANQTTVRIGNEEVAIECTPSESRALAKELNDTLRRFFKEKRPVEKLAKEIGPMTREEKRLVLLLRYAVMYGRDLEESAKG